MEVMIRECMQALREVWAMNVNAPMREMMLRKHETDLEGRYGSYIVKEASKRLKDQGVKRN